MGVAPECLVESKTQAGTKELLRLLSSFACLFPALPMGVTHVHNRTVFRVIGFAFVIVHVPAARKRKVVGGAASAPYGSSPRVLGGVEDSSKD